MWEACAAWSRHKADHWLHFVWLAMRPGWARSSHSMQLSHCRWFREYSQSWWKCCEWITRRQILLIIYTILFSKKKILKKSKVVFCCSAKDNLLLPCLSSLQEKAICPCFGLRINSQIFDAASYRASLNIAEVLRVRCEIFFFSYITTHVSQSLSPSFSRWFC